MTLAQIWDHVVGLLKRQLAEPVLAQAQVPSRKTDDRDEMRHELRHRQT